MKFLLVAGYSESLTNFRGPLIEALIASGQEVHAAAPGLCEHPEVVAKLLAKGVRIHSVSMNRTGMNPWHDLKTLLCLYRLMRQIRPERVLGYTIKPVIYGSLAAWLARVPERYALVTGLGYAFAGESGQRTLLRRIATRLYQVALHFTHRVFFQNPDDRDLFVQRGILSAADKTVVVNGSGIDISIFSPMPLPAQPAFLLIARLLGDKGVREYVTAARLVHQQYPQCKFRLAGWIDDAPDAIAQAELDSWIQDGVIEFLGRLKDVRPAIADSTIYVLPSYREGTPRTVLEAMAMARAVITTDAPGCRETVIPGVNGLLVPIKSAEALAQAMLDLVRDRQQVEAMGQQGRRIAEQKYDVQKVNQQMLTTMGIFNK
ncbi:glycosyltransferase family 4 protein [Rheinheimera texasensis]|uniref:glycosyltransferase family 4 protein n=1 Tax=Rheinheimera texasensis TaxID=306205 RepID=UPI0032B2D640